MHKRLSTVTALTLAAAMLSACGGGGGSKTIPTGPQGGGSKTTMLSFTIAIPTKATRPKSAVAVTPASVAPSRTDKARPMAHPTFVRHFVPARWGHGSRSTAAVSAPRHTDIPNTGFNSYSTKSIAASVGTTGSIGTLPGVVAAPYTANVAPGYSDANTVCGSATNGAYSCTFEIPAPVGYDDFQFQEWDGLNGTGHLLAIATIQNQLTKQNQVNTLSILPSGVVQNAAISMTANSLVSGATGQSTILNIEATDYDGNLITGNQQFVDSTDQAVAITATGTVTPAGAAGDFTNLTGTFGNPSDQLGVAYDPTQSNLQVSNVAWTLTSTGPGTPAGTLFNTTLNFTASGGNVNVPSAPQVTMYAPAFTGSTITDIVTLGGLMYVNEGTEVAEVTTSGAFGPNGEMSLGGDTAQQIIAGADGDIWYVTAGNVAKFKPSTPFTPVTDIIDTAVNTANFIGTGADGRVYYSDSSNCGGTGCVIGAINPQDDSVQVYNLNTGVNATSGVTDVENVAAGPTNGLGDGTIWFTDDNQGFVYVLDTVTGAVTSTSYTGDMTDCPGPDQPSQMVEGRDGMIYVMGACYSDIATINPSTGAQINDYIMSEYIADTQSGMAVGPDGNVWATDTSTSSYSSPTFGNVAGFDVVTPNFAGAFFGYYPPNSDITNLGTNDATFGMTLGPDGNLWFTDYGALTNTIGVLHL